MSPVIRQATEDDAIAVGEIFCAGDRHHAAVLPHRFREGTPATSLAHELSNPSQTLLVAEHAGAVVGVTRVIVRTAGPPHTNLVPRTYGEVNALVVREGHRGRGIGTALLAAAERWMRERGVAELELSVWDFNREAIALYERLGYATISRRLAKPLDG